MMVDFFLVVFLIIGMSISVWEKKLTVPASLIGGLIGYLLYSITGFAGLALMTVFFILAVLATSWKIKDKINAGLHEKNPHGRTASQVLANAGVAAVLCILTYCFPQYYDVGLCMIASAFASATSDTLSSEIGNISGKRYYNILTFKKDRRGENGVVSAEGLAAGITGSILVALVYSLFSAWKSDFFVTIMIAGFAGNLFDSILGATLERKKVLNNNAVNFWNTFVAALMAAVFVA